MLSQRELKILNSIINSFIETGQPVGSRTIEKNYDIGLSAATIRNVMSDLEEKGFISKTHHSSGRIPSGFAIENYVLDLIDSTTKQEDNPRKFVKSLLESEGTKLEKMMLKAGEVLNLMTNYATLTFIPHYNDAEISQVFAKRIDDMNLLFVIMTKDLDVSTNVVHDGGVIDEEKFNNFLKHYFYDRKVSYFLENLEELYKKEFFGKLDVLKNILKDIESDESMEDELILSGVARLLEHPDFIDSENVKTVAMIMEDSSQIKDLIKESDDKRISVHIGDENSNLKNLTVITSNILLDSDRTASFGIIAPVRMNYSNAINAILELDKTLRFLHASLKGDEV